MLTLKDILVDGSDWEVDLCKLVGKQVKTVKGYLSMEFSVPVFKMTEIVLEDGSLMDCEGEHDFPYLTAYRTQPQPNFDEKTLTRLYQEGHPEDDE